MRALNGLVVRYPFTSFCTHNGSSRKRTIKFLHNFIFSYRHDNIFISNAKSRHSTLSHDALCLKVNKKKRKSQKYNSALKDIDLLIQKHIFQNQEKFIPISSKKIPSNFPEYSKKLQLFLKDQKNTNFPDFHL